MDCTKPFRIFKNLSPSKYPDGLEVPCGKCYNCRIQKRREWTTRILHETYSHDENSFFTLTYSPENEPENMSLKKSDLQKFFKRLRKNLGEIKIRYFACGEYGSFTQRPHYHMILFGIGPLYSDIINKSWNKGFIYPGLAQPDSIRYVAQYIDKKFSGDEADEEYVKKGREPVFRLLSLGLGRDYCDDCADSIITFGYVLVNGHKQSIPRYYVKRLGIEDLQLPKIAQLKEIERVEKLTGFSYTRDEYYKIFKATDVLKLESANKKMNTQTEKNTKARNSLKRSKI